jgi:cell division protein FtsQ
MRDIGSVSPDQLKDRRQALQSRRKLKTFMTFWRFLVVCSMAGGIFWVMTRPNWIINQKTQIEIEGNQWLSREQIYGLIPLTSSRSLWQLQTQRLIEKLKAAAPIADAKVTRQLLPPKLIVEIRERQPVAIVSSPKSVLGFLDKQGILIPKSFYTNVNKELKLPTLKVIGWSAEHRPYWAELYQLIRHSSIKIFEIDWRNPSNLVLKTELGIVYCGSDTTQFSEQLNALAQMRTLSSRVPVSQIAYIDLNRPASPSIQLKQIPKKISQPPHR